ncbi:hypothetical protein [Marinobacter sp.]|uniref:hypothetical protein n=1 Tax=Marinobacter sp. TaxID=50741 RepID=UPI000C96FA9E|nr:hypothetical protein [Marinobacter sp.]MAK50929.1 hypothetical protein [Marinobacter sp.]
MTALDRNELLKRWEPLLEGIGDDHIAYQTARLFENQAKEFTKQRMDEELSDAATTTGKIGTFQKFAFPLIRRTYPELVFNKIGATQAMDGPVSQIFYMGNSRALASDEQVMYSKFNITPRNLTNDPIGSVSARTDGLSALGQFGVPGAAGVTPLLNSQASAGFDVSNVINITNGSPSTTMGGKLASFPNANSILGYSVSAAERLKNAEIPEVNLHIQKQTVQARERKMRALWTLEAAQDLKAYHNLDMEAELTDLLSKEMNLEIDRELIEDIRMIAYGPAALGGGFGGWYLESLYQGNADNFPGIGGTGTGATAGDTFVAGAYEYDFNASLTAEEAAVDDSGSVGDGINRRYSNIFVMDLKRFSDNSAGFAPQTLGHVFSNVLAMINRASTDIYRTTLRGPGNVLITSPVIASMLESAAKLEGGLPAVDGPTNMAAGQVQYVGKFAGKYDLIVDPMFPEDEIIVAYKGANAMDAGYFYCPYIPVQPLDTVVDPETFQPRKGILTRYGKVAVQPASRFYRVIRIIGAGADYLSPEMSRNTSADGNNFGGAYSISS